MAKKIPVPKTLTLAHTFAICKKKSVKANLSLYIEHLKRNHSNLSTREYLNLLHEFLYRIAKEKGGLGQKVIVFLKQEVQVCKGCGKWAENKRAMRQCTKCQDFYHQQCEAETEKEKEGDGKEGKMGKKQRKNKQWECSICQDQLKGLSKQKNKQAKKVKCFKCKQHEEQNQTFNKCLRCFNFFHRKCFGNKIVVCEDCDTVIRSKMDKQRQLTLRQSFAIAQVNSQKKQSRLTRSKQKKISLNEGSNQQQSSSQKSQPILPKSRPKSKSRQKSKPKPQPTSFAQSQPVPLLSDPQKSNSTTLSQSSFSTSKNFLKKFPPMTQQQISHYQQQLRYSILTKNMEYCEDLVPVDCDLFGEREKGDGWDGEDSLDFGVMNMSISDYRMYREYKKQPIGPFLLQFKEQCGYDVIADKDLPKGMIVCQYVGDVYTHRHALTLLSTQKNDSVMLLKIGHNADTSLFIVPHKYTNIARFINGINPKSPSSKLKQNVTTIRTLAQGKPVVLLYTNREIKKGESLMYDYGAGLDEQGYDTSSYV